MAALLNVRAVNLERSKGADNKFYIETGEVEYIEKPHWKSIKEVL